MHGTRLLQHDGLRWLQPCFRSLCFSECSGHSSVARLQGAGAAQGGDAKAEARPRASGTPRLRPCVRPLVPGRRRCRRGHCSPSSAPRPPPVACCACAARPPRFALCMWLVACAASAEKTCYCVWAALPCGMYWLRMHDNEMVTTLQDPHRGDDSHGLSAAQVSCACAVHVLRALRRWSPIHCCTSASPSDTGVAVGGAAAEAVGAVCGQGPAKRARLLGPDAGSGGLLYAATPHQVDYCRCS